MKKKEDETVDYSVGARVLHISSPSYALCYRNLTVQLLVPPSSDKVAWAEKLLLITSSILSLPGRDPFLREGSCISTLAERSPSLHYHNCGQNVSKKKKKKIREFIIPYLPLF